MKTKAWCIKSPSGHLLPYTVKHTRTACIENFMREYWGDHITWRTVRDKYEHQCVKVCINEKPTFLK